MIYEVESSDRFILKDNRYTFTLTSLDIEALEKNKELIKLSYENQLKCLNTDYKPNNVFWNWRYPIVRKEI